MDCTAGYTTTQADVDRGSINNTGTAVGTTPSGPPATATSSVTIPASQNPGIALTKTASLPDFATPGTKITYSYTVTNSGNLTLNPVKVTDPMADLSPISCLVTTLAPDASEICTATYTTTQADVDRGSITNTGTATGTPPSGPAISAAATVTVPAIATPRITLLKSASVTAFSTPGESIRYDYVVTNAGNVTLDPVVVTDPMLGLSTISCPSTSLGAGTDETCTALYTTTQADVDRGAITNKGTATGTPPTGSSVSDTSTATVPALQTAIISLQKSANKTTIDAAGTMITYSYAVRNGGNVTLNPVVVTDLMPGLSTISCPTQSLGAGTHETCTATYATTDADLDRGSITNEATVTGTPPTGPVVSDTSTVTVSATQKPAIGLVKTADATSFDTAGAVITYTYKVTNTGNVTLTALTVTDPMPGLSAIVCQEVTPIAPAASITCSATYTTTQADVNTGSVTNTATATGTPPVGTDVTASGTVTVPAMATPAIALVKSASIKTFSAAGVGVTYSFLVTNTGQITLDPVTVTDPLVGLSAIDCKGVTALDPGQAETCSATYTTTQANVDAGGITNTATAIGTTPTVGALSTAAVTAQAQETVTAMSSVTIPATQAPGLSLVKSANVAAFATAGTKVTYSYLVINTGNVTVTGVRVVDPMTGLSAVTCPTTSLAPTASVTCTATYTTTAADLQRGSIVNAAFAAASPAAGVVVVTRASTVIIPVEAAAAAPPAAPESPVTPETIPVTG